jgi:hypothetical protein
MTNRRLARTIRSAAKQSLDKSEITTDQYYQLSGASHSREYLKEARKQLEKEGAPWAKKGISELNFQSIWDWFIENWPTILKILQALLTVVPLFMDDLEGDNQ